MNAPASPVQQPTDDVVNAMEPDIYQQLGDAIAQVDEDYARLLNDPRTKIEPYPTPFLQHYQIFRITLFTPAKPVLFYVGFAPPKPAYLLTSHADHFLALAKADGVKITSPKVAMEYAIAYLEVTRTTSHIFYVLNAIADIKFRPNLAPQDEAAKAAFISKYSSLITAPNATIQNEHYIVTAYAIRKQTLERHTLTISHQGEIQPDIVTLESDLPLVYGGR